MLNDREVWPKKRPTILGPICCTLERKQMIWEEARTHANPLAVCLESARLGLNYKTLRGTHEHKLIVESLLVGMKNCIKKPEPGIGGAHL